jgi:hypothetical protein
MNEFSLDAAGAGGLERLLARASDDAFDVLDYAKRQCAMDWQAEGLLLKLIGPHEHAYSTVTGALAKLQDLSSGAANQVALAVDDYTSADLAAERRLGPAYGNAGGPEVPADFADVAVPGSHLTDPGTVGSTDMWSINPLTDLISPASWVRQVSVSLFGYDPFDGWARALGGDWASYVHAGAAISRVGDGAYDIGQNLLAGARDAETVWVGSAADAEREFQTRLGTSAQGLREACASFSQLYGQAADAAADLRDVAGDLISDLLDLLIMVNLAAAVGTALVETGFGAIAGYGIAAYYAGEAYKVYQEIARYYGAAEDLFEGLSATIGSIHAEVDVPDLDALQPYQFSEPAI